MCGDEVLILGMAGDVEKQGWVSHESLYPCEARILLRPSRLASRGALCELLVSAADR